MPTLGNDYVEAIINVSEAPCVSIYQPTHRMHPENVADPIRFNNLVTQIEESLVKGYPIREVRTLLEPLHQLRDDAAFWNHTLDGLVVLASPTRFDVFKLAASFPESAIVADSFNVKPLLRYVQSADRYQVLAIAEDKLALFEGNRYALDPIESPHVSGQIRTPAGSDARAEVVIGQGIEGYFRMVDAAVAHDVSKPSGVPLILAALSENLASFRAVAKNPYIIADAISGIDPFSIDAESLRQRAWAVLEPHYLSRLSKLCEDFGTAASREQGTGDLSDAARAAVAGRISILLVDADQVLPGTIDPTTGEIKAMKLANPLVDDKLDDLAEIVLRMGGEVVIVPTDRMPTKTGLAAIYRY